MAAADPLTSAQRLADRVYALLLDARRTRDQLEAMTPSSVADQAERDRALAMALAFEVAADDGGGGGDVEADQGGGGGGVVEGADEGAGRLEKGSRDAAIRR